MGFKIFLYLLLIIFLSASGLLFYSAIAQGDGVSFFVGIFTITYSSYLIFAIRRTKDY